MQKVKFFSDEEIEIEDAYQEGCYMIFADKKYKIESATTEGFYLIMEDYRDGNQTNK